MTAGGLFSSSSLSERQEQLAQRGRTETWTASFWSSRQPQEEFVPVLSRSHFPYPALQGPHVYLKGAPIFVPSDRSGTIAPDENPGSPSPEKKPSKLRGWTGRLTRSVLSEAGGHLSRVPCSTSSYKSFPGKQTCPGRTRRAKAGGRRRGGQAGGACRQERQAVCPPFVQASRSKSRLSTRRLLLTSDKPLPSCLPSPAGEVRNGYADGQQGAWPWHRASLGGDSSRPGLDPSPTLY